MQKPTLILMAAGIGSRYGGLKQIDPIGPNGEIIIDYSIFDALRAGFGKIVFVITEQLEQPFREKIGKTVEQRCETVYVYQKIKTVPNGFTVPPQRQKPWGTGHATLSCKDVVNGPCAVLNADDFYGRSSFETLCAYLNKAQDKNGVYDYSMVGYILENTLTEYGHVARGVCTATEEGYLEHIRERTRIEKFSENTQYTEDGQTWIEIPKGAPVSMNMWGFTPSIFSELENRFPRFLNQNSHNILKAEFFLPNVVGDMIQEKQAAVKILPTTERWFGITYQQDKPRVKQAIKTLIQQGIYPENLWGN